MNIIENIVKGQTNWQSELMVFDWDKAARLIKKYNPKTVTAGLEGDWEFTGGLIYKKHKICPIEETYVYLASTWAIPEICLDDGEFIDCYKMQSETDNWNAKTYWPESARRILIGE